jgi:hypothetical protein
MINKNANNFLMLIIIIQHNILLFNQSIFFKHINFLLTSFPTNPLNNIPHLIFPRFPILHLLLQFALLEQFALLQGKSKLLLYFDGHEHAFPRPRSPLPGTHHSDFVENYEFRFGVAVAALLARQLQF